MNFGILVNEGPYQHQASDSAYLFAKAAIEEGHTIFRVFFYHDGVNNGTRLATPPQDDRHIPNRWSELARENNIDLVLCVAAAQRRGMVDPDEMKRNNKDADNIAEKFRISAQVKSIVVNLIKKMLCRFSCRTNKQIIISCAFSLHRNITFIDIFILFIKIHQLIVYITNILNHAR